MTRPLHKHTLLLFKGDFEILRDLHPNNSPSEIIRTLIEKHIKRVQVATPTLELNLEG